MSKIYDYPSFVNLAAQHLAGRRVEVRFRPPYLKGCSGMAYNDRKRGAVIDVDPSLSDSGLLAIFLHELAHIRLDWQKTLLPSSYADEPPASVTAFPGWLDHLAADPAETPAARLAHEWLAYSDNHWKDFWLFPEPVARLWALFNFPKRS